MSKLVKLFFVTLASLLTVFSIAHLPVRKGFMVYKLADTQYEKLLWLDYQFEEGKLRNEQYRIAVFGSSSALYGFNDSIT